MGNFFNKKWFDKKAEENNPKLPSLQEMKANDEEYFNAYQIKSLESAERDRAEKDKKEYLRLKKQAEMNQKMYGQTGTPNGLYSINASQFATGASITPGQILQYTNANGSPVWGFHESILSQYPELNPLFLFLNDLLYIKDKGRYY